MAQNTSSTSPTSGASAGVLVTGASSGIGAVYAERFAQRGQDLVLVARDRQRLDALAARLRETHKIAVDVMQADLTQPTDLAAVESRLRDDARIGTLINNAGMALAGGFVQQSGQAIEQLVRLNTLAPTRLAAAIAPRLAQAGAGAIVNVGSVVGFAPEFGTTIYGATKAFVRQFSLNLRADLYGTPVRVTDIQPGLVGGTEFSNVRFHGDDAKAGAVYEGADALTPDDIADAVHWVATRPARVNVNMLQVMPVSQSFGPLRVHKPGS